MAFTPHFRVPIQATLGLQEQHESLNFTACRMSVADVVLVAHTTKFNTSLKALMFVSAVCWHGCALSGLSTHASCVHCVHCCSLADNRLTPPAAHAIGAMLGSNSSLHFLDLSGNPRIGIDGAKAVAYGSKGGCLRVLRIGSSTDLPVQELHGKTVQPFDDTLAGRDSAPAPPPTTITLDEPAFNTLDLVFVAETVYQNTVLLTLDLSYAGLTEEQGDYLGMVLARRHNTTVCLHACMQCSHALLVPRPHTW